MNSNKPTASDRPKHALRLIEQLPQIVLRHVADLGDVRQRLEELEGRTCTGHPHWRDKNASGKTPKLYVLHRTDTTCPIHGKPAAGQRHRIYVGNKPDKIADALAAIEREIERRDLQRKLDRLQEHIDRVTRRLRDIYFTLGHTPPELGQDPLPPPPDITDVENSGDEDEG